MRRFLFLSMALFAILTFASCRKKGKDVIPPSCFVEITSVEISGGVQDNYSLPHRVEVVTVAADEPAVTVTVDADGSFTHTIDMTGKNSIEITGKDEAIPENSVTSELQVR